MSAKTQQDCLSEIKQMKIHAELLLQQLITRRDKTGHY
jgi:hypothetical protein